MKARFPRPFMSREERATARELLAAAVLLALLALVAVIGNAV